jgi:hypothetical protein
VHQNLTFPVHPDPVSGMHCWHQRVRVERAESDDNYGDVVVDTKASHEEYRKWLEMTRPAPALAASAARCGSHAQCVQLMKHMCFMTNDPASDGKASSRLRHSDPCCNSFVL